MLLKMSNKMKNIPANDILTCEKYINKMLRNERMFATKRSSATPQAEKHVSVMKPAPPVNIQRNKPRVTTIKQPVITKPTPTLMSNKQKDSDNCSTGADHHGNRKPKTRSRCRSASSSDRESWGQILNKNMSKDKLSSFSIFDPLRTVHFLSRELYNKLQILLPDDDNVIQMISDIQLALRRMPSEVTNVVPPESEKFRVVKPAASNKCCQTPPTLYQEDTEKFRKIMEENTCRLEISCQQLELVCMNLQKEKEITERELEEAREHIDMLYKKVQEFEELMTDGPHAKIKQLEAEKEDLEIELSRALEDKKSDETVNDLKKQLETLQQEKSGLEENCTKLEYDITLLKMEKEKFITMLSVRDREIKEIQEEMSRIQAQVNSQLKKLNIDVSPRVDSLKNLSDPSCSVKDNKNVVEIGDSTISSINTNNGSEKDHGTMHKEFPCGDAEIPTVTQDLQTNLMEKLSRIKSINSELLGDNRDNSFEDILKVISPSCRTLLTSSNN